MLGLSGHVLLFWDVCLFVDLSSEIGSPSHQKLDWVDEIDQKVLSMKNPRVKDDIRLDWEIAP